MAASKNSISNNATYSVLGGGQGNSIQSGAYQSFIGGGSGNTIQSTAYLSFIGGGYQNLISSTTHWAVLGGGYQNSVLDNYEFLGGGSGNKIMASAQEAALVGGIDNTIGSSSAGSFIGAGGLNTISNNDAYAVLAGGYNNTVDSSYAFMGAGLQNSISSSLGSTVYSVLVGGQQNTIQGSAILAFLGGGQQNIIRGQAYDAVLVGGAQNSISNNAFYSFLGGGQNNFVAGYWATVGGGFQNSATNSYATVPGGSNNVAGGLSSFAAGSGAQAVNPGAFVWADAEGVPFSSTNANSFNVRANGGVRLVTSGAGLTVDGLPVLAGNVSLTQLLAEVVTNNEPNVSLGSLSLNSLTLPDPTTIYAVVPSVIPPFHINETLLISASGYNDLYVGLSAGNTNGGTSNTGIGAETLLYNTTGSGNAAEGYAALTLNTNGNGNTGIGALALSSITSGSGNIGLGYYAGYNLTSGSNNIDIGNTGVSSDSGVIRIGTTQASTLIAGVINGNGGGLTGLNASQLTSGTVPLAQLPAGLVTNNEPFTSLGVLVAGSLVVNDSLALPLPASITSLGTPLLSADQNGNSYFGLQAGGGSGSGNIGIGNGGGDNLTTGNNNIDIGNQGVAGDDSIIRIGTPGIQAQTFIAGVIQSPSVTTITITGGSDLAEPFSISTTDQPVSEGEVVVIDEANPGQLKLTDRPYDTRVAGVVSGANGIHPGIQMHQQGLLEGGKNVALTGRVYVQADTSNGAIKPGDLLTTSSTPGHAMKVTDHAKAAGAILGKAMTALSEGKGMVLVLVTLQ